MKRALESDELEEETESFETQDHDDMSEDQLDSFEDHRKFTNSLRSWFTKHTGFSFTDENWSVHFGLCFRATVYLFQKYYPDEAQQPSKLLFFLHFITKYPTYRELKHSWHISGSTVSSIFQRYLVSMNNTVKEVHLSLFVFNCLNPEIEWRKRLPWDREIDTQDLEDRSTVAGDGVFIEIQRPNPTAPERQTHWGGPKYKRHGVKLIGMLNWLDTDSRTCPASR